MKILLLTEYFPDSSSANITGGVESRCYNIARKLAREHKITVITSWKKGLKRTDNFDNITISRVGPHHQYSNKGGFISRLKFAFAAIKEGLRHGDADIIDGYNFTTYLPAYVVAKKINKPVIATYHETWVGDWIKNKGLVTGLPYDIYERLILKLKFDKIIAVSNYTKKRVKHIKGDIVVIPNGTDENELSRIKANKENTLTLCFIGRLVKTKKVDVLIRAVAILKDKIPKLRCKIIGKGTEYANLNSLAKQLGVESYIEFLGFVEDKRELMRVLKSCHVFCFPSILEGFGIVIIEAMALGTPYVCSDIEVLREITDNGKGGLLFKTGNPTDLADKVVRLLDKRVYKKKVVEGKKLVLKYDWDLISHRVEKTYIDTIKKQSI